MFESPTHGFRAAAVMMLLPACAALAGDGQPAGNAFGALLHNKLVMLFTVITAGLLLGRVRIAGLSLGSSGVIFTALAAGHFGYDIPGGVGKLGVVLFVYAIGIIAGPRFFRVFRRQGKSLAVLGVALVAIGAMITWALSLLLTMPVDLAAGVFAGALTSTPGLAAAMASLPEGSGVAVGYGIAYPFGVVGVVLFVQLLPRLLRADLGALSEQAQAQQEQGRKIVRVLVEVCNPAAIGKRLSELDFIAEQNCQVPRVLSGDRLVPVPPDFTLTGGQHVLVIGREFRIPPIIYLLGRRSEKTGLILDTESQRHHVCVSSPQVVGKTLRELSLLTNFGVTVSRIIRHDVEFVPKLSDEIEYGDMLIVVGEPKPAEKFAKFAGHRAQTFDETDVGSLGIGIIAGLVLGSIRFGLGDSSFTLGVAGGPLFVALLLGHFHHIGPIKGHLPRASRMLMMEFGLVCFLADAGVNAGHTLMDVIHEHGLTLCLASTLVALVPMILGYPLARFVFRMNLLQILGGICGGMTSTPGLAVVSAKVDSDVPVISYAAAYPVALIMITVFVQVLVSLLT